MAGWETCRHSYSHILGITLGRRCQPSSIQIDTYMHLLNAFKVVGILGCDGANKSEKELIHALPKWVVLLPSGRDAIVDFTNLNRFLTEYYQKDKQCSKYQLLPNSTTLWKQILPLTPIRPDTLEEFENVVCPGSITHLMVIGLPDGGIHRLGVYGHVNKL